VFLLGDPELCEGVGNASPGLDACEQLAAMVSETDVRGVHVLDDGDGRREVKLAKRRSALARERRAW
jgi:hypothetical protein